MNWAVYRAYTRKEMRYYDFVEDKVSFLWDLYDFGKKPYCRKTGSTWKKPPPGARLELTSARHEADFHPQKNSLNHSNLAAGV
jgi:hypothetical protein